MKGLIELGISDEDAKLLKDRRVFLVRAVLVVSVNAVINNGLKLKQSLYQELKLK